MDLTKGEPNQNFSNNLANLNCLRAFAGYESQATGPHSYIRCRGAGSRSCGYCRAVSSILVADLCPVAAMSRETLVGY